MRQTSLPLENLRAWSHFNDVRLFQCAIEPHIISENGTDKGGGLVAEADHGEGEPLTAVPLELVLSKERVEECAKSDPDLRELIEAAVSLFQVRLGGPFSPSRHLEQGAYVWGRRLIIVHLFLDSSHSSAVVSSLPDDD